MGLCRHARHAWLAVWRRLQPLSSRQSLPRYLQVRHRLTNPFPEPERPLCLCTCKSTPAAAMSPAKFSWIPKVDL